MDKPIYYLVDSTIAPEVFCKVIEVKRLLQTGKAKTINEAVATVAISRSAFYKYRDFLFPFNQIVKEKIITISFMLQDKTGLLCSILNIFAEANANILSINQNVPLNGLASVVIALETGEMEMDIQSLIGCLEQIEGVSKIQLLASE